MLREQNTHNVYYRCDDNNNITTHSVLYQNIDIIHYCNSKQKNTLYSFRGSHINVTMSTAAATTTTASSTTPDDDSKADACCCSAAFPSHYDEQTITWDSKPFIVESTWCFLYMPLNFAGATRRAQAKLAQLTAGKDDDADNTKKKDGNKECRIMLSDMISPWSTRIYFAVDTKNADDSNLPVKDDSTIVKMSGTFLTKVFEGPYSEFKTWIDTMTVYVKQQLKDSDVDEVDRILADRANWYAYYMTCPKCAKTLGKNYTVLFVKVSA